MKKTSIDGIASPGIPAEYHVMLERLRMEGGVLNGPDGQADRLFGPVIVRLAERDGYIVRDYTRYWGMGEEIRLTGKGRRTVGLAPEPLLTRIMAVLRRPRSQ